MKNEMLVDLSTKTTFHEMFKQRISLALPPSQMYVHMSITFATFGKGFYRKASLSEICVVGIALFDNCRWRQEMVKCSCCSFNA